MAAKVTFRLDAGVEKVDKIRDNLSAAVRVGEHLFLGSDEGTVIERLTLQTSGDWAAHQRIDLAGIFDLPKEGKEIDVEGMAVSGEWLWVTGSHSRKRPKPKSDTAAGAVAELLDISAEPKRCLLGRMPLAGGETDPAPVARDGKRKAESLRQGNESSELLDLILADDLLRDFVKIPSKDNGLDIEGLAVRKNRVWLGLRGPVLRGWAVVLELEMDLDRFRVGSWRKHLLQMDGLGVRDLLFDGDDLLVLAGPTMVLDGPVRVYRWKKAALAEEAALVKRKKLDVVLEVPFGDGTDHAEAIEFLKDGRLLVVYDSPAEGRLREDEPERVNEDAFSI